MISRANRWASGSPTQNPTVRAVPRYRARSVPHVPQGDPAKGAWPWADVGAMLIHSARDPRYHLIMTTCDTLRMGQASAPARPPAGAPWCPIEHRRLYPR